MTTRLRELLVEQRDITGAIEQSRALIVPWVFHRNGKPIRDFYGAWRTACAAAGVSDRIPHDFRRTAVRNLERAGVPRSTAKAVVGHQTDSVYARYAIVDASMLKEGIAKLDTLHTAQTGTVVEMNRGKKRVKRGESEGTS